MLSANPRTTLQRFESYGMLENAPEFVDILSEENEPLLTTTRINAHKFLIRDIVVPHFSDKLRLKLTYHVPFSYEYKRSMLLKAAERFANPSQKSLFKFTSVDGLRSHSLPVTIAFWYLFSGFAKQENDNYRFVIPKNVKKLCIVCGAPQRLSRHHVVPQAYLRFLDVKKKPLRPTLKICVYCHRKYEIVSRGLKEELGVLCGCEYTDKASITLTTNHTLYTNAYMLLKRKFATPEQQQERLVKIKQLLGKEELTDEDLQNCLKLQTHEPINGPNHFEEVVKHHQNDLKSFFRQWHEHFIETMRPCFSR